MPRVEWVRRDCYGEPRETGSGTSNLEASDGARLIDLCDEARAPVSFSCRSATCGTCLVRVLQGHELLEEPGGAEIAMLEELGLEHTHRLACQANVRAAVGLIRLECVGPDRREPEVE